MSRPNLYYLATWENHVERVLEIFNVALVQLASESTLPLPEDNINRKLLFYARKANYQLIRLGRGTSSNIMYEASNQPAETDKERAKRESKRPDFQCGFVDHLQEKDLFFLIECKRLGNPPSPTWILNSNYINNGVQRFINPEWGYGAGVSTSAMIGYIQSMTHDEIFTEVNAYGVESGFPEITYNENNWQENGVSKLEQTLNRRIEPSPFLLHHLWVDLRIAYLQR
ncbi:hypothetical protein K9N50_01275 [bacterium]|nr:hypothetical protein [bacterium]